MTLYRGTWCAKSTRYGSGRGGPTAFPWAMARVDSDSGAVTGRLPSCEASLAVLSRTDLGFTIGLVAGRSVDCPIELWSMPVPSLDDGLFPDSFQCEGKFDAVSVNDGTSFLLVVGELLPRDLSDDEATSTLSFVSNGI
jgi:hypothetical protein